MGKGQNNPSVLAAGSGLPAARRNGLKFAPGRFWGCQGSGKALRRAARRVKRVLRPSWQGWWRPEMGFLTERLPYEC
jgi:hypothetical protein